MEVNETVVETQEQQAQNTPTVQATKDPFSDDSWVEQTTIENTEEQKTETKEQQQSQEQKKEEQEEIFDADEYLKTQLGFESWDAAKTEYENLKKLKEQKPFEYKNEDSRKVAEYVNDPTKRKELRQFLETQERLENLSTAEVNKDTAEEIIKLGMQLKYKDLSQKEIDYKYNKEFGLPKEPVKNELESDEDFEARKEEWQSRVSDIEMNRVIEAKLSKPELLKHKTELVLPEINKPTSDAPQQGLKPEEVAAIKTAYRQSLEGGLKDFNGYNVTATALNGEVKLPVSYAVTNEEKIAQKAKLEQFDMDDYFGNRWAVKDDPHGINSKQLADDIYLLENKEKIFQKIANDAANKAIEHYIKSKSNVNVNGKTSNGTFNPDARTFQQKQEEAIWSA